MSFWLSDRLQAAPPVRPTAQRRLPDLPRIGSAVDASVVLAVQRQAGNRTASALVLQRCGAIPPDQCPCNEGGDEAAGISWAPAEGGIASQEDGPGSAPAQDM